MRIRAETSGDAARIRAIVAAAFARSAEADLVDALRRADGLIVSAVAEDEGRLLGHVAFSPATVGDARAVAVLAPVAVAPGEQRRGVGSALVRWGLDECRRRGHTVVTVLGDPRYYARFGFVPASRYGIASPFPVPDEAFRILELAPGAATDCRGTLRYRPEFAQL